jgi:anti-anti-sigma factor
METHIEGTATNRYGAIAAGGEAYGFLIRKVKEIIGRIFINSVSGAPAYVKGMGNEVDSVSEVLNIKGGDIDGAMVVAMKNEISADGAALTIFIGKRFDITTFEAFRETYKEKMDAISSVNIDMMDCAYIDNSALSMLLMMRERFSGDKANIFIANISPNVKKILLVANFDRLFKIES